MKKSLVSLGPEEYLSYLIIRIMKVVHSIEETCATCTKEEVMRYIRRNLMYINRHYKTLNFITLHQLFTNIEYALVLFETSK